LVAEVLLIRHVQWKTEEASAVVPLLEKFSRYLIWKCELGLVILEKGGKMGPDEPQVESDTSQTVRDS
jgi:hypothetical protein